MLQRSKISATQFIVASVFLIALIASAFLLRSSVAQSAGQGRQVNPYGIRGTVYGIAIGVFCPRGIPGTPYRIRRCKICSPRNSRAIATL